MRVGPGQGGGLGDAAAGSKLTEGKGVARSPPAPEWPPSPASAGSGAHAGRLPGRTGGFEGGGPQRGGGSRPRDRRAAGVAGGPRFALGGGVAPRGAGFRQQVCLARPGARPEGRDFPDPPEETPWARRGREGGGRGGAEARGSDCCRCGRWCVPDGASVQLKCGVRRGGGAPAPRFWAASRRGAGEDVPCARSLPATVRALGRRVRSAARGLPAHTRPRRAGGFLRRRVLSSPPGRERGSHSVAQMRRDLLGLCPETGVRVALMLCGRERCCEVTLCPGGPVRVGTDT